MTETGKADDLLPYQENESTSSLHSLYNQALRRLAQREYGEEELRRKLKGYSENLADTEAVIDQLKQSGQLSDDRFIEAYIQARVRRGFGPARISAELYEKGITQEELEKPLSVWNSSWTSVAKRVIDKKYNQRKLLLAKQTPEEKAESERLLVLTQKRFLLYRGFSHTTIQQIFSRKP